MIGGVELETRGCPLGCEVAAEEVLTGRDRLLKLPGEFSVVRCRTCDLMRTDPRPTPDTIGFYYPDDYEPYRTTQPVTKAPTAPPTVDVPKWKRHIWQAIELRNRPLPPLVPGRMLEVGCGSGSFLYEMAERGWQVEGIEFSKTAAERARAIGLAVRTGSLESVTDPSDRFDLIVGWMVLEHLHEPVHALKRLRRWAKPEAWLVLSVPDAGSWEFKVFQEAWYALSLPTHLFHFTPQTLRAVLVRSGWRAERILWHENPNNLLQSLRYRSIDRHSDGLEAVLFDIVHGRRHHLVHWALGKVLGKLRASGRMTVWARPVAKI